MDRDLSHRCPGPECALRVSGDRLACRAHWYQVSKDSRDAVWEAWANGAGRGSAEHRQAIRQAVAEMKPL